MAELDGAKIEDDGDEVHFLSVPGVADAFERMLDEFSHETDRGAVLIAADIVADTLGSIIDELRPTEFSDKRMKQLLGYPGLLATFSARSDVAFIAGFIDANAHGSTDKLRKLRNHAAHSQGSFRLANHREILRGISDLGPGVSGAVNRLATEVLIKSVVDNLQKAGVSIEEEIGSNPFSTPTDVLDEIHKRPEAMEKLEGRVPRMELAVAVWILLGLMKHKQKVMRVAGVMTPSADP
ncbi:MAG: hypothetical protein C0471_10600 [Erythrobacter sp.]|nr:hypothetical protein [Erythrobacter sp.]